MKLSEHSEQIKNLFRSGDSYEQIGRKLGVSRQAIQQHLYRRGVRAIDGGFAVRKMLLEEEKRRKFRSLFGCTREQRKKFIELGLNRPFTTQRRNARLRGNSVGIDVRTVRGNLVTVWRLG